MILSTCTTGCCCGPNSRAWLLRWKWPLHCAPKEAAVFCCKGQLCNQCSFHETECDVLMPTCLTAVGASVPKLRTIACAQRPVRWQSMQAKEDRQTLMGMHHGSCCPFALPFSAAVHVLLCQPGSASYVTLAAGLGILHQTLPMVIC